MCIWACTLPLESVLLAMIHSQFVYSFSIPLSRPSFPIFLRFSIQPVKKKNSKGQEKMKCTNDNYADVKERKLGAQMYGVVHLLTSSPWVGPGSLQIADWLTLKPQRLYVTGMVGFQRVFEAGSCCSWPAPPALVPFGLDVSVTLCAYSMPKHAQFFYLSLPLSFSSLLYLGVCFFMSYMEKIMKVFESKHLCCGYWVWVFVSAVFLCIYYKSNKRSRGDAFTEDGNDIMEKKKNHWVKLTKKKSCFTPKQKK